MYSAEPPSRRQRTAVIDAAFAGNVADVIAATSGGLALTACEPRVIETTPVRTISMMPKGRRMSTMLSILSSVPVISTTSESLVTSTMRAR